MLRSRNFLLRRAVEGKTIKRKDGHNSVFRVNIAFAAVSKPFPALSGTIQSVLVFALMDHSCQVTAVPSSQSVFGYGAHAIFSAPIPTKTLSIQRYTFVKAYRAWLRQHKADIPTGSVNVRFWG